MKASTTKNRRIISSILIFAFWIAVWQIAFVSVGREIYFPAPLSVLDSLSKLALETSFWMSVLASIMRVFAGLLLSIVLGVIAGIACCAYDIIDDLLRPLVTIIRSTPVISFIIIALVWFDSSDVPIFICFLMCFPIILTNVIAGIRNTDPKLLEMARIFRVRRSAVVRQIYVPSVKPYFTASTITSLGLGWKASVAAEVLSHPRNSIGYNIYSSKAYLDSSGLFAWTVVVVVLSFVFEILLVKILRGKGSNGN